MGRCIKAGRKQTGKSQKARDRSRSALKPGLRASSRGKKYFENRKNRSDVRGSGYP